MSLSNAVVKSLKAGEEVRRFTRHKDEICSLNLSLDASRAISADVAGEIWFWHIGTNDQGRKHQMKEASAELTTISPNNRLVAWLIKPYKLHGRERKRQRVGMWNLRRNEYEEAELQKVKIKCLAFSLDGTVLACGLMDGRIALLDTRRAFSGRKPKAFFLREHRAEITELEFSPDGRSMLSTDIRGVRYMWSVSPEA